jgi:actin-like ATPase involved in cell morphogenesis
MRDVYALGIDLGTTFTAAATARAGRVDVVSLGDRSPAIPSVVALREDGVVVVGEAAERRAVVDPGRSAREFKRRVGDTVPILLGGTPYGAEILSGYLLAQVLATVVALEGERPALTCVTHPANWGPFKRDLLREAARHAELGEHVFLTEPEAAAIHYASRERLADGDVVAVYDLGGGTFDSAVVRRRGDGFEIIGVPEGIERLGGIDFDQAVLAHVDAALDGQVGQLDLDDPGDRSAMLRLRDDCRAAKEGLSTDSYVAIPVLLPKVQTEIRLTRAELEKMVRPRLVETVAALDRTVRSAGLTMDQVDRILLVGGSSRIPLVAELLREATGRPVAVDAHPKYAIASGAAMFALDRAEAAPAPAPAPDPEPEPEPVVVAPVVPAAPIVAEPVPVAVPADGGAGGRRPPVGAIAGVLAALAAIVVAVVLLSGGDEDPLAAGGSTTATTAAGGTTASSTASTQAPTTGTTLAAIPVGAGGRGAAIDGITIEGDHYAIFYRTEGFDPLISEDPTTHHLHFFFDTVDPTDAGMPGSGPWAIWDTPSPMTDWKVADRPDGAEQMCVLVANSAHEVEQETGNCFDLPDG